MIVASWYPEGGMVPDEVWWLIADLGIIAAVAAILGGLLWLWRHGPEVLINNGPSWMTTVGNWILDKRETNAEQD